jgi:hypothetical protein
VAAGVASAQSKPAATAPSAKSPTTTEAKVDRPRQPRPEIHQGNRRDTTKSKYSGHPRRPDRRGRARRGKPPLARRGRRDTVARLCDIDSKKLDKAGSELSNAKKFGDFRDMLDKTERTSTPSLVSCPITATPPRP